jgi:hypothetical protein
MYLLYRLSRRFEVQHPVHTILVGQSAKEGAKEHLLQGHGNIAAVRRALVFLGKFR